MQSQKQFTYAILCIKFNIRPFQMVFGCAHQFGSVVREWVGGGEAKGMAWRSRGSEEGVRKSFLERTETLEWSIGSLDHSTRPNGH